jgi:hypothetical protein
MPIQDAEKLKELKPSETGSLLFNVPGSLSIVQHRKKRLFCLQG